MDDINILENRINGIERSRDYSSDILVLLGKIYHINACLDGIDDLQDKVIVLESQVAINIQGIVNIRTACSFQRSGILQKLDQLEGLVEDYLRFIIAVLRYSFYSLFYTTLPLERVLNLKNKTVFQPSFFDL
jgi:hypothetical protein